MIQRDRLDEIDRQLTLIERGGDPIIVCPWCSVITRGFNPESPDCCFEFREARDKRGERQFATVKAEHRRFLKGEISCISCPYCGDTNYPPDASTATSASGVDQHPSEWKHPMVSPFCCELFVAAVRALAYGLAQERAAEKLNRIGEALERASRN